MPKYKDFPHFQPDYTTKQMFQLGIMGGSYFRPIHSSVTNKDYKDDYKEFKFLSKIPVNKLTNSEQDININKYKQKASLSLEYWESHGWVKPQDPRGTIQWMCRFHQGRRTQDDKRQIHRALRVLIRFGQKKNPSDRIKQALLHWGWRWDKDHTKYIKEIREYYIKEKAKKIKKKLVSKSNKNLLN